MIMFSCVNKVFCDFLAACLQNINTFGYTIEDREALLDRYLSGAFFLWMREGLTTICARGGLAALRPSPSLCKAEISYE